MKKVLVAGMLGALAALVPAGAASAAQCLQGGTTLDVREPLEGSYVIGVPLYTVDPHCLDHLLP